MSRIQLSFAVRTNPRIQAVVDNAHAIEGVELVTSLLPPADTFWRQLRFQEFDISEMSLSAYIRSTAAGDRTWWAIPVFPDRRFFHASIVVRTDSDITSPADLKGKRIGCGDYSMTGAMWGRAMLQHDFGVLPQDMIWYQERVDELSHGGASGFAPPPGLRLEHIGTEDSQRAMFADGRLDASILFITYRTLIDRSAGSMEEANVRPLFPDIEAEKARAYAKWGWLPFNHCMVIRRELVERHPWLALNLYSGFLAAKDAGRAKILDAARPHYEAGLLDASAWRGLDVDLFPYGVRSNASELDALMGFMAEQGLTPRRVGVDELFPPNLLDL